MTGIDPKMAKQMLGTASIARLIVTVLADKDPEGLTPILLAAAPPPGVAVNAYFGRDKNIYVLVTQTEESTLTHAQLFMAALGYLGLGPSRSIQYITIRPDGARVSMCKSELAQEEMETVYAVMADSRDVVDADDTLSVLHGEATLSAASGQRPITWKEVRDMRAQERREAIEAAVKKHLRKRMKSEVICSQH